MVPAGKYMNMVSDTERFWGQYGSSWQVYIWDGTLGDSWDTMALWSGTLKAMEWDTEGFLGNIMTPAGGYWYIHMGRDTVGFLGHCDPSWRVCICISYKYIYIYRERENATDVVCFVYLRFCLYLNKWI